MTQLASRTHVIFDLFHTLVTADGRMPGTHELLRVDRDAYLRAVFNDAHDRLTGAISDPADVVADIARRAGSPVPESAYAEIARARVRRFAEALGEIDRAILAAVDALVAGGKTLALISNADAIEAAGWPASPLATRFETAVFSCHVGLAKPDPAIFRHCLDRLGIAAGDAVYVGDGGSNEFEGARAVGLTTVCTTEFIRQTRPNDVERMSAAADYCVDSLSSLAAALLLDPVRHLDAGGVPSRAGLDRSGPRVARE
ncbi:MAG: HAD family hydrolase [Spirochaetota bacterium]